MRLSDEEQAWLNGEGGPARAFAMDLVRRYGAAVGAPHLIPITRGHVDGCLYHGAVSLDFIDRLVAGGGRVAVPTTLNVGSLDLIHPNAVRVQGADKDVRRRLMDAHTALGCTPSFTCAPYHTLNRPAFGEQIAWGESNAIAFANSVIGARTNRYGDFIDLACAVAGRAPAYGLHLDAHRQARRVFRLTAEAAAWRDRDALCVAVGHHVGARTGDQVPVIEGLDAATEDQLKALGAVAASSGAVALFHVVGVTPEAPDLATACGGAPDACPAERITADDLTRALAALSPLPAGAPIQAVSLGTPHYSLDQLYALHAGTTGWRAAEGVRVYANVGRDIMRTAETYGLTRDLRSRGVQLVTDTCVYVTAVLDPDVRAMMTDSGKLAHYAPGNLGVDIAFGSLADCLASAAAGHVVRTAGVAA